MCAGICTWQAYMIASSCRADSRPFLIVDSGMDRVYVMSGGGTLDRVFVSTTMSGWEIPIVAEEEKNMLTINWVSCCIRGKKGRWINGWTDVQVHSSGLHLEGLYSAYVSTCPSSSASSSSASSSSSVAAWVVWGWKHHRDFSNVITTASVAFGNNILLFQLKWRQVRREKTAEI